VPRSCKEVELSCKLPRSHSQKCGTTREVIARDARSASGRLQCACAIDKGQTRREAGTQNTRTSEEVAGLPNRNEQRQMWDHKEWEPGDALRHALGGTPSSTGTDRDGHLAGLEPHLREALMTLEDIERRRGLSEREKTRVGVLGMLLASVERTEG
jgi:hypothetical protein